MKTKAILIGATILFASTYFSQDSEPMTNKNGYVILPESGDYALQMDATPILDFGLNVINIMDDKSPNSSTKEA